MSVGTIETSILTDIANAIRYQAGVATTYKPRQMAAVVAALVERFINNESHDPSCGITGRTRRREEGVSHGCDHHMPGARRG